MGDLVFNGGKQLIRHILLLILRLFGAIRSQFRQIRNMGWKSTVGRIPLIAVQMPMGSFRFTIRNVTVNNAQTGIYALWNWGKDGL